MNEIEKQDLTNKITFIPYWVKNESDFEKFCAHLNFRLHQKTVKLNSTMKCLQKHCPLLFEAIAEDDEILKEQLELENFYHGDWRNGKTKSENLNSDEGK